ncbi:hypothetical protein DSCA_41720 [Desulfosarcina alkanivorans]|jgi:hypothetical protein|uniref:Lipoprotein n=1 Tax=Desulfosarcina alkanivorans TaxID=571177 RepID=A0A5K7YKJ9_9BACT|nr:hypothetical protein [Desulfosarcina alkanivorans]BBO70242.1 hypothetical protein DSCA_41720 [Desulfosarcina alkanivorans]
MMKKRVVLLVGIILLCMAACITAQEPKMEGEKTMETMNIDVFKKKLEDPAFLEQVSFFVAYDRQNAVPIVISTGTNKDPERIGNTIKKEVFQSIIKENSKIKTTTILQTHGSPGCQIMTAFGEYIVTCW